MKLRVGCVVVGFLSLVLSLAAQTAGSSPASAQVPPLIQFSNVATDEGGNSLSGVLSITFSLYNVQQGGEPLWAETQNVQLDATGHYSVQLGITKPAGVPTALFTSGQAHWLGIQIADQAAQSRVLLLSVPYALKAGDAETIGGLPPSAFVLAATPNRALTADSEDTNSASAPPPPSDVTTSGGTAYYLPVFNGASTIIDSVLYQSGTGSTARIGINTTAPASTLDVKGGETVRGALSLPAAGTATASGGKNSQPLNLATSAFSSTSSTALNQTFQWLAEPADNDTSAPSGTLHLRFGEGATKPSETGLHIASNRQITFATGQTFPGVPQLGTDNTFTANQTVNGSVTATSTDSGVVGNATASSGAATGVYGTTASTAGYGVEGYASANLGAGATAGVYGVSSSVNGYGVEGLSSNIGVYGNSSNIGVSGAGSSVGVEGSAALSGGTGVLGMGTIGVQGVAASSAGLAGLFKGTTQVSGKGNNTLIGDPGCGPGWAGLGFLTSGSLSGCTNYALLGGPNGGTYVNSSGTASIHFRSNNNELATIDNSGNLDVIGQNGGGNLTVAGNLTVNGAVHSGNVVAAATASNQTGASTNDCTTPLSAPDPACLTPNMTLTVTTSGGPVLVMANIGGVQINSVNSCDIVSFYLVMDNRFISTQQFYGWDNQYPVFTVTMMALPVPAAGTHTFQVQEADDPNDGECGSGDYYPTIVSWRLETVGPGPTRTLIVREF